MEAKNGMGPPWWPDVKVHRIGAEREREREVLHVAQIEGATLALPQGREEREHTGRTCPHLFPGFVSTSPPPRPPPPPSPPHLAPAARGAPARPPRGPRAPVTRAGGRDVGRARPGSASMAVRKGSTLRALILAQLVVLLGVGGYFVVVKCWTGVQPPPAPGLKGVAAGARLPEYSQRGYLAVCALAKVGAQ